VKKGILSVIKSLREAVRGKRLDLWKGKNGPSIMKGLRLIPPSDS
jgi:hypothetical protein